MENVLDTINIQHLKLVSGDEVVGLIRAMEKDRLVIESPLSLNMMPTLGDTESFFFTEWMPMSDNNVISIYINSIVATTPCNDLFKEHYIRTALKFKVRPIPIFEDDEGEDEYIDDDGFNIDEDNDTMH